MTTDSRESTPPPGASDEPPRDTDMLKPPARPRSLAAYLALLLAIVLLPPWVALITGRMAGVGNIRTGGYAGAAAGLIAAALGVLGLVQTTRQRRRRGRGLAIAAIPLGLIAAAVQGGAGSFFHGFFNARKHGSTSIKILKAPESEVRERAAEWYASATSARFKVAASEERFQAWLEGVLAKHGQLQTFESAGEFARPEPAAMRFRYIGRFVNGTADIEVVVGLDNGQPVVDDIWVGKSSPLPQYR